MSQLQWILILCELALWLLVSHTQSYYAKFLLRESKITSQIGCSRWIGSFFPVISLFKNPNLFNDAFDQSQSTKSNLQQKHTLLLFYSHRTSDTLSKWHFTKNQVCRIDQLNAVIAHGFNVLHHSKCKRPKTNKINWYNWNHWTVNTVSITSMWTVDGF